MTIYRALLRTALASLLLLAMGPLPAPIYMKIPAGESFKTRVQLSQPVLCDGSVRLEPGAYDVAIRSLGDGSVRATFTGGGKTGHATGKVQGNEGVVVQGGLQPGAAESVQKVQPGGANAVVVQGGRQPSAPPTFATLGFTPQSQASFHRQGNKLNVVLKGQGSNQILIGLLLPAVQNVREAASAPAH
jgi:hypothetical protein